MSQQAAAASSTAAAAGSTALPASAASSQSAAAAENVSTVREDAFYTHPPAQFVADLSVAVFGYIADTCDSLEKAIAKDVASRSTGSASSKQKNNKKLQISEGVDTFFDAAESKLQAMMPALSASILRDTLSIPPTVLLGSEMAAAADGFGAASRDRNAPPTAQELQEEAAVKDELARLQQRVIQASRLNRELRTKLLHYEQDESTYAAVEESFTTSKKDDQANAKLVSDLQSVSSASSRLRPLHGAVSSQFVEVFGADSAGELTASLSLQQAGPNAAAASSTAAAAAAAAANSSVTQQINLATLRAAQQQDFTTNVGAGAGAGAAASSSSAAAANAASAASGMNIADDAGDLI